MKKIIILLSLAVGFGSLHAKTTEAVSTCVNPAPIGAHFHQKQPIGKETFVTFFMTIYDIALWMEKSSWDFNQKSAIRLEYKRDVSKEKIMHYSMGSMEYVIDDKAKLPVYEKLLEPFINTVKEGDTFTFVYLPDKGIEFFFNEKSLGICPDQDFAKTFMNIWLHPKTEYPDVREAILGLKN